MAPLAALLLALFLAGSPLVWAPPSKAQEAPRVGEEAPREGEEAPGGDTPADEGEPAASRAEGDVHVDPETGARYRLVRPDDPMRRGPLSVASWVAIGGGVLVALAAVAALALRLRRSGRLRQRWPLRRRRR